LPRKKEEKTQEISILLTHLYRDMSRAISQHTGMSFSRLLLLHELMHEGEVSQSELQKSLGMEGALVTRFVKQMETGGLVSRRVDPKDNRYTLVSLTQKGKLELGKAGSIREESETQLLDGLTEKDKVVMVRALKRIQENIAHWED
jgi:DNA-binding MarR family transcriptional regulator